MTSCTRLETSAISALPAIYISVYALSAILAVVIAIRRRQVKHKCPILCNAGAWYPSYYIFGFGLSFSAAILLAMVWLQFWRIKNYASLVLAPTDAVPDAHALRANRAGAVFGTFMSILLGGMGIVNFHEFEVAHNLIAIAYIAFAFLYQLCIVIALRDIDASGTLAWRALTTAVSVACLFSMFIPAKLERERLRARARAKAELIQRNNMERERRLREQQERELQSASDGRTRRRVKRFGFASVVLGDVDAILAAATSESTTASAAKDNDSERDSNDVSSATTANVNPPSLGSTASNDMALMTREPTTSAGSSIDSGLTSPNSETPLTAGCSIQAAHHHADSKFALGEGDGTTRRHSLPDSLSNGTNAIKTMGSRAAIAKRWGINLDAVETDPTAVAIELAPMSSQTAFTDSRSGSDVPDSHLTQTSSSTSLKTMETSGSTAESPSQDREQATSAPLLLMCGAQPDQSSEDKAGFTPEQIEGFATSYDKQGNPIANSMVTDSDAVFNYMVETKNPAARYPYHLVAWALLQYGALLSSLVFYGTYIGDFRDLSLCLR